LRARRFGRPGHATGRYVLATENLLAALPADLRRFVHVSSFSVYDFDDPRTFGTLSEETAIETHPSRRDRPIPGQNCSRESLVRHTRPIIACPSWSRALVRSTARKDLGLRA
jgi:nucleoside-diphosphate-sugar epimerase